MKYEITKALQGPIMDDDMAALGLYSIEFKLLLLNQKMKTWLYDLYDLYENWL